MEIIELSEPFPLTVTERSTDKPHVGEIIHRMLIDLGVEKRFDEPNPYQFEKGFVWERLLSMALPNVAERPGEIEQDGIICSPDGIGYSDWVQDTVVEEYKCTARSSSHNPGNNVGWMMQIKAYCKAVGVTNVVMRILHLNGDYKTDRNPTPKTYLIQFTQGEIDTNWNAILNYARDRGLV